MKEQLLGVDDALVDRVFQPLADCVGALTGWGVFRLARCCLDAMALAWIAGQSREVSAMMAAGNTGAATRAFAVMALAVAAITMLRAQFLRPDGQSGTARTANPLRPAMQVHRILCLFWIAVLPIKIAAASSAIEAVSLAAVVVFGTAAVYIGACSNPPPQRRIAQSRSLARPFLFARAPIR